MVRGGPDFGAVAPRTLTVPVQDLGELAARLGSPVVADRQGNVIEIISGLGLREITSKAGVTSPRMDMVPERGRFGGYTMRMYLDASDQGTAAQQQVAYLGDAGAGLESLFRKDSGVDMTVLHQLVVEDDTDGVEVGIRWDTTISVWRYWSSAGTWIQAPTQTDGPVDNVGHSIKVTGDPVTKQYLRAVVDGVDLGVRGIAGQTATSGLRRARGTFSAEAPASGTGTVWLSHMIYTVNEI